MVRRCGQRCGQGGQISRGKPVKAGKNLHTIKPDRTHYEGKGLDGADHKKCGSGPGGLPREAGLPVPQNTVPGCSTTDLHPLSTKPAPPRSTQFAHNASSYQACLPFVPNVLPLMLRAILSQGTTDRLAHAPHTVRLETVAAAHHTVSKPHPIPCSMDGSNLSICLQICCP